MNTTKKRNHRSRAPRALDLALSQISDALKASGKERLTALVDSKDGYAQMIWLLEKLSKCSLEWLEHDEGIAAPQTARTAEGISAETEKQLRLKLEGTNN